MTKFRNVVLYNFLSHYHKRMTTRRALFNCYQFELKRHEVSLNKGGKNQILVRVNYAVVFIPIFILKFNWYFLVEPWFHHNSIEVSNRHIFLWFKHIPVTTFITKISSKRINMKNIRNANNSQGLLPELAHDKIKLHGESQINDNLHACTVWKMQQTFNIDILHCWLSYSSCWLKPSRWDYIHYQKYFLHYLISLDATVYRVTPQSIASKWSAFVCWDPTYVLVFDN